jgi:hypothetical protein
MSATATAMGIEEGLTAPRAPWQNPFVESFIGSAPRDCFDHVIVFNEAASRLFDSSPSMNAIPIGRFQSLHSIKTERNRWL